MIISKTSDYYNGNRSAKFTLFDLLSERSEFKSNSE